MDGLFFYLAPAVFGVFVGAFSTVGVAQDFQAGHVRRWRVLVPWVLSTITGVIYIGLLKALTRAVEIGPSDPNTTSRILSIFVSCLAGAGLGGLYVLWPFLNRLALGWKFFEVFTELKVTLSEQELRVLLSALSRQPAPGLLTRLAYSLRRQQPPSQRERVMKELGIDGKTFDKLYASALRKFRAYFRDNLGLR